MSELGSGVYVFGEKHNPPVLLLHSSQSASSQWRDLIQRLSPTRFVIAVDLLGYGRAPQPEAVANFRLADEVPRVVEAISALKIDTAIDVIGHSYGGALALKLALEQPFTISKLAVYEPVAFHVLADDSPGMIEIQEISQAMHGKDAEECTRTFVDYWNRPGYFDALPFKIQALMVKQAAKVALDFDALLNEPKRLDDYAGLEQPVLMVQGEHTRRSAKAVADALSTVISHLRRESIAAGHMGPLTHPAEVNEKLVQYINS
ncbi:alpha/beta hydrolase [Idiomarina piscisalsi]|uniref:Alpha/beta hydrolase n=1 Tax=Idiomarina piscisalsi TaxID=1096243 RepID=A0ABM6LS53_9GAMM|nr:alpha/beta hydrolase [Idiomarina piscisalsi]ASG65340.1 alpha/beta hydrolase [Idiomarina piscisalsi]